MIIRSRLIVAGIVAALALGACSGSGGSAPGTPGVVPEAASHAPSAVAPELLYVADAGTNSVTVYPAGASGNVAPARTIAGPRTGLSNEVALAEGVHGDVFVLWRTPTPAGLEGRVVVFAPGANGNVAPMRTLAIRGYNIGFLVPGFPTSIAVDRNGYVYVAIIPDSSPSFGNVVSVYAPGASGDANALNTFANAGPAPQSLAVNRDGDVFVLSPSNGPSAPFLGEYQPFPANGLSSTPAEPPAGFHANAAIAVSPVDGDVYTLDPSRAMVRVWSANVTQGVRFFTAPDSGLGANAVAVDAAGEVYVARGGAANAIHVYAANASGSVKPVRSLRGPSTGLMSPVGIAIGP